MTPVLSPNDGSVLGEWQPTPDAQIAADFAALERGSALLARPAERKELLERVIDEILRDRALLADLIVDEVGKRPSEARDEIDYAVAFLSEYAVHAGGFEQGSKPRDGRQVREVASGVAVLITPFNDPIAGLTRKIGAALAAGCPVLVKPSPLGTLVAVATMRCLERAGCSSVARLVLTDDGATIERIVSHPATSLVSFTGSTATGRKVAASAGAALKKVVLELGGNCPMAILPGADLRSSVDDLMARKVRAAGQACSAINRVLVHQDVLATFKERLAERVAETLSGPARDADVGMGPVRTRSSVSRLERLVARARQAGEGVLMRASARGSPEASAFPLTVLEADMSMSSLMEEEEAFGPLVSIRSCRSEADILARLETERHALACYVYGADDDAKEDIISRCRYGSIGLDTIRIQDPATPTGGFGLAGFGREGGRWGVAEYLTTKNVCARTPS